RRWFHRGRRALLPWPLFEGHDLLRLFAKSFDGELHHVAGLEPAWRWPFGRLVAESDAGRCAGGDDVARVEHEELRAVPDDVRDAEDHRFGRSALPHFVVDGELHAQVLGVLDLVAGNEPRS